MDDSAKQGRTKQGLKSLYSPQDAAVDVIAVPGLSCPPEASFEWTDGTKFNWLANDKGLKHKDSIPQARVMLFQYNSAYTGKFAVNTCMVEIGRSLLHCLNSVREKCKQRPLIFIGHSMGGLVVAQALALANSERSDFPHVFECFAGCLFFGTPFRGSTDLEPEHLISLLKASNRYKESASMYKSLLTFLSPKSDALSHLLHDTRRLETLLDPKIEFYCFYEQETTESGANVEERSAVLDGTKSQGLTRQHRNLVRFEDEHDILYTQYVLAPLKQMVGDAKRVVKKRLQRSSLMYIAPETLKDILNKLESASVANTRKELSRRITKSKFILSDEFYRVWASPDAGNSGACLLIKGPEGRGKTSATLAIVEDLIQQAERLDADLTTKDSAPMLAYYFCDEQGASDAEEVLKSILYQLIKEDEALGIHAKGFVPAPRTSTDGTERESTRMQLPVAALSLENMWLALRAILASLNEPSSRRVYIVVSNIHKLDGGNPSTGRLFEFIRQDVVGSAANARHRWLFTARTDDRFTVASGTRQQHIDQSVLRIIDLEDGKYGKAIKLAISEHAGQQLEELKKQRDFNRALFYWSRSAIATRAPSNKWVDLACLQLKALPTDASDTQIRRTLELCHNDFDALLQSLWESVLAGSEHHEDVKMVLRALVLTFRDPTLAELSMLCGFEESNLKILLETCSPLVKLIPGQAPFDSMSVQFATLEVRNHLRNESGQLLGMSPDEHKGQHIYLAWRCLSDRVQTSLHSLRMNLEAAELETANAPSDEGSGDVDDEDGEREERSQGKDQDHKDDDDDDDDEEKKEEEEEDEEEMDDDDDEEEGKTDSRHSWLNALDREGLLYAVQYWLHHGRLAGEEFALPLSQDAALTDPSSTFVEDWLSFYLKEGTEFDAVTLDYSRHSRLYQIHEQGRQEQEQELDGTTQMDDDAEHPTTLSSGASAPAVEVTTDNMDNTGGGRNTGAQEAQDGTIDGDSGDNAAGIITGANDSNTNGSQTKDADDTSFKHTLKPIHIAAAFGFSSLVRALSMCDDGDGVNAVVNGYSPIHFAASNGHADTVECLIECHANLDLGDGGVGTALHMAAAAGKIEVVQLLLDGRSDEAHRWRKFFVGPIINSAILSGNSTCTTILMDRGMHLQSTSENFMGPLAMAASRGDDQMLRAVLNAGRGKWSDSDYNEALREACFYGQPDAVKVLHESSEIEATDAESVPGHIFDLSAYQAALALASNEKEWETMEQLLECCHDADLDCSAAFKSVVQFKEVKESPIDENHLLAKLWNRDRKHIDQKVVDACLFIAADNFRTSFVRWLLDECRADPEAQGEEWGNALTAAANDDMLAIVELLLAKVDDVAAAINRETGFALQAAAKAGHLKMVEFLVNHGADVNRLCVGFDALEEGSALQAACVRNQVEIAGFLLSRGADVNLGAGDLTRPIIAAARQGFKDLVELLLKHPGVLINEPGGPDQSTPLINAAFYLPVDTFKLIVEYGADIDRPDADGDTALTAAARAPDIDIVRYVCENGADFMHICKRGMMPIDHAVDCVIKRPCQATFECVEYLNQKMQPIVHGLKMAADSGESFAKDLLAKTADTTTTSHVANAEDVQLSDLQLIRSQKNDLELELDRERKAHEVTRRKLMEYIEKESAGAQTSESHYPSPPPDEESRNTAVNRSGRQADESRVGNFFHKVGNIRRSLLEHESGSEHGSDGASESEGPSDQDQEDYHHAFEADSQDDNESS